MNKYLALITLIIFSFSCSDSNDSETPNPPEQNEFLKGVDISFLPQIEASGYTYTNSSNQTQDALSIFKSNGINTVRLRLWKNPETIHSSFDEVKTLAQRVKNKGMKIWLTIHYSDTWADPGHQEKPEQWQNISFHALKDSVYNYTKKIVAQINPDYIQIGNEINSGFLLPEGNLTNNPEQFKELLNEGLQAVNDYAPTTKTMIHFAGHNNADWFFGNLTDLDYDIIALSYYPFWHGTSLTSLETNITNLKTSHNKDVIIAETAYPFTLDWNDWTNNIIGSQEQLIPNYPATPQGQLNFISDINQICLNTEALGFCYWAPEWVAYNGSQSSEGSAWENLALFDFNGKVQPAISIFND
jgi:arabinogalactan endo-1,4-beta-galactosidase